MIIPRTAIAKMELVILTDDRVLRWRCLSCVLLACKEMIKCGGNSNIREPGLHTSGSRIEELLLDPYGVRRSIFEAVDPSSILSPDAS